MYERPTICEDCGAIDSFEEAALEGLFACKNCGAYEEALNIETEL